MHDLMHGVRRDAFAPLLTNPLAALLREHDAEDAGTHAVPTGGAPTAVTTYDDGRRRINLGSNNYLGLADDPRVVESAVAALRRFGTSTSGSGGPTAPRRLPLTREEELALFSAPEPRCSPWPATTATWRCCRP